MATKPVKSAPKAPEGKTRTLADLNMSVGNFSRHGEAGVKSDGVKIRGTGAATKGTKARGPMA